MSDSPFTFTDLKFYCNPFSRFPLHGTGCAGFQAVRYMRKGFRGILLQSACYLNLPMYFLFWVLYQISYPKQRSKPKTATLEGSSGRKLLVWPVFSNAPSIHD